MSTPVCAALIAVILAAAAGAGRWALAIYGLAFWHYYLYFLAYRFGAAPLRVFKRDAVMMKTAGLAGLAAAWLAAPLDPLSPAIVAAGFLLNALAAARLGSDRTYYGHELAGLPPLRITAFPYSLTAHPMLYGNIAAYAGTLVNDGFRARWWPLAGAHVLLNLALLAMETRLRPLRRGRPGGGAGALPVIVPRWLRGAGLCIIGGLGAAVGAGLGGIAFAGPAAAGGGTYGSAVTGSAVAGAAAAVGAALLLRIYSRPPADRRQDRGEADR